MSFDWDTVRVSFLWCDRPGCQTQYRPELPGVSAEELRRAASRKGWCRDGDLDYCGTDCLVGRRSWRVGTAAGQRTMAPVRRLSAEEIAQLEAERAPPGDRPLSEPDRAKARAWAQGRTSSGRRGDE